MTKITKKAQQEMIGLAIIVTLLAVGLLMFVKFTVLSPQTTTYATVQSSELANNFLSALLNSNAGCSGSSLSTFEDLINKVEIGEQNFYCNNQAPTEYLNESIRTILNKTLYDWNYKYMLLIPFNNTGTASSTPMVFNNSCDTLNKKVGYQPIITDEGKTMVINLTICQ